MRYERYRGGQGMREVRGSYGGGMRKLGKRYGVWRRYGRGWGSYERYIGKCGGGMGSYRVLCTYTLRAVPGFKVLFLRDNFRPD